MHVHSALGFVLVYIPPNDHVAPNGQEFSAVGQAVLWLGLKP